MTCVKKSKNGMENNMLYVLVQIEDDCECDTLVGIFPCNCDAENFRDTFFSRDRFKVVKVGGHWIDLMDIRKEAGC